jgi:L-ascorbate metabolism protein UlaG (beta-lactamase superfamily)
MRRSLFTTIIFITLIFMSVCSQDVFEKDTLATSAGDLEISFIGHATLMFGFDGKIVYADPVSRVADFKNMPKADLILVTHEHGDHFDTEAIKRLSKKETVVILSAKCSLDSAENIVMKNNDTTIVQGIRIEAVPAYNIIHKRKNGRPFHEKGTGNGYVITFSDKRIYIAGDTENIPEMKNLTDIDAAFLPMNLPYTMSPAMAADAARSFRPKILYPYHYGDTNTDELIDLLKEDKDIEIRIRNM